MPSDDANPIRQSRIQRVLWNCLDGFICIFVLAPLVVFYWRGSFQLLDIYVFPSDLTLSAYICCLVGIGGTLIANVVQTLLHDHIHVGRKGLAELLMKRIYTYVFGWMIVNHWRGVWRLWDAYTGMGLVSGIISFASGCFLLLALKCFRNLIAPPLVTVSDFDSNYFTIKTRFRTTKQLSFAFLTDTIFSIVVPGSLVVSVWRGQWSILDHVLYRPKIIESLLISLGLGFGIVVALFFLQRVAGKASAALEQCSYFGTFFKIMFEDLFFYIAALGAVNIWRGVWGLCDHLLLVNDYQLSNWICHIIGGFGTMVLLHGNSVLVRDVQIDGEYSNGEGCRFFSKSLTLFKDPSGTMCRRRQDDINGNVPFGGVKVHPQKNVDQPAYTISPENMEQTEPFLQEKT